ncbi:hypothetical protein SAMN05421819_1433 [Bryocella elongata]|uniref:DUF3047 domain-containing protein n=1 Tax=Bryocella elongata TaxID=863522 RepID=A0A1H5W647_9BACT|nr:hypothetical protein [Bryocella elongata]SEF94277.1 hypothetical protein SAMN05421819_1433 [Bryocella elongata]
MQPIRRVLLLFLAVLCPFTALAAPPKSHTVALGPLRKVPYTPPEANADNRSEEATTLRVRPLTVDGAMKEWTVGDFHDVTDRTFVIRRALRINDALPGEAARWSWQPGPWLSVDRVTGHITALHLPDFDPQISEAIWYRDYAAYCGLHVLVRSTTLTAIVFQLGARRAAVSQKLANWPLNPLPHPVCAATTWQRTPIRATLHPTGLAAVTFDLLGTTSLVEDTDEP